MTVYAGKASNASNGAIFDQELSRALTSTTETEPEICQVRFQLDSLLQKNKQTTPHILNNK